MLLKLKDNCYGINMQMYSYSHIMSIIGFTHFH